MRLIDRMASSRGLLPDPEQVAFMQQTWPGQDVERIKQTYLSYVVDGYCSNPTVFATVLQRINLLSQAEFKYQNLTTRKLFGDQSLSLLEEPWANGTTADLIGNMEQHASLSGNAFVRRTGGQLVCMRPDWVDIVSVEVHEGQDINGQAQVHREVVGYLYSEGGIGINEPVFYPVEDVAHWAPIPDPLSLWRGMSWMTPVLREINADTAMTRHRMTFFENAGTPNLVLRYKDKLQQGQLESIRERWNARYAGPKGAGATVVLDEGADLTVVGSSFEAMRFNDIQAAGEARIAQASGVPAIVAGLQIGLDSSAYNVYKVAMKAFIDTTATSLWQSMCSSLAKLVEVPSGCRLWWDTSSMPALREDAKDRALAAQTFASALSTLIMSGFTPDSAAAALVANDMTQLKHSGLVSVQLYKAQAKQEPAIPEPGGAPPPVEAPEIKPPSLPAA